MSSVSLETTVFNPLLGKFPISVLLIDDQALIAQAVHQMIENQPDIHLHFCRDPAKAFEMANEVKPTVILQDLIMPDIDGLVLVKYLRANPLTHDIPLIVLSSKEDPKIKAEAFALGANDYMVKLPDKAEFIARIRYHSAAYIRLLERNQAFKSLEESQKILNAELAEAASYVRSVLPAPLDGKIKVSWRFIPSTQLGGDAFGYNWLDQDHFSIYLLDVCGHGVGAALLSITLMNVIRSLTLQNTDFFDPQQVLTSLNENFLMENHHDMFFTMWYGIYNKSNREINYSCGGHPPGIVVRKKNDGKREAIELKTPGLAIGAMSGSQFQNRTFQIQPGDILYLFSDGVYELAKANGAILELKEFEDILTAAEEKDVQELDRIQKYSQSLNGPGPFPDDFSIVQVIFP